MISWESILSVFDTKGTLLKWLQELEKTLNNGVLQSVSVNPVSTGVITLSFNFADGTTITTPQIDLPQGLPGPQGVPGADGADGKDGTNGRDALVQNRALSSANISSPMAIPLDALNRTAVVGEPIVMFATDTTENKTYMLIGTVTNVGSPGVNPYVFVTYSNKVDITGMTGPQGIPGTNGKDGESFNPMGHWIGDNEYHPFDYVNYGGSSYLCTATIIDGTDAPPIDTAHWQLVAEKGDAGEAPGSGGGSGIYKHYITDAEGSTATIFTNSADTLTEWPTKDAGTIVVSLGHVENSDGLGNLLFFNDTDPTSPNYVYTTEDGSVRSSNFTEVASDEVTVV